ncbi:hypothetical protein [Paraburkholderia caledonica]|uniref:Transcriptional regulator with XRE-family HTH domain n=1 Tax=Paraburkholderia caledonica TaxID=134536 RepID=A0ABU1KSJ2_9BURK|nr:hypothetical protein [Paraburkholderia caledonica]MDR6373920.1 transcriptional regulator with XRE-family HTH domain [Paraburkholderia caledonica]
MSFDENVKHIRYLLGWTRGEMLKRLCPNASGNERARVSQQVCQLERRSSRRSELLLPISELFGIAPSVLLNRVLTSLTLEEVRLLRDDPNSLLLGQLIAIAWRFALATGEARSIVEKAITADRDQPYLVPKLSVIVDAYLEGVRTHCRRR